MKNAIRRIQIKHVKLLVAAIVGAGTGKIVSDVIDYNTPEYEGLRDRVTTKAGGYVIGAIAAERSKSWTDAKIDEIVEKFQRAQIKNKPVDPTQDQHTD